MKALLQSQVRLPPNEEGGGLILKKVLLPQGTKYIIDSVNPGGSFKLCYVEGVMKSSKAIPITFFGRILSFLDDPMVLARSRRTLIKCLLGITTQQNI